MIIMCSPARLVDDLDGDLSYRLGNSNEKLKYPWSVDLDILG